MPAHLHEPERCRDSSIRRSAAVSAGLLRSQRPEGVARSLLLGGLRVDYRRACKSLYCYAFFAEQAAGDGNLHDLLRKRGQAQTVHCLVLGELRARLGDQDPVDEVDSEAIDPVEVMSWGWPLETARFLWFRAQQCVRLGYWEGAAILQLLADAEESLPGLAQLLSSAPQLESMAFPVPSQ